MNDLIKALTILNKYFDREDRGPTWCGYEVFVVRVDPSVVSKEDTEALEKLDFFPDEESFISFRFGS